MKKTTLTEDTFDYQAYFDGKYYQSNQMTSAATSALENDSSEKGVSFGDKCFSAMKWIFLYLPGAVTIHFLILGFALSVSLGFLASEVASELLLGSLGAFAVAAFMIMLGIGKLLDLRYLKVVAAITVSSLSMAILYLFLESLFGSDFFGFFLKATLPLTVVAGFLAKTDADRKNGFDKI